MAVTVISDGHQMQQAREPSGNQPMMAKPRQEESQEARTSVLGAGEGHLTMHLSMTLTVDVRRRRRAHTPTV
jgi:hypothetical protein